jgi:hypothetical protein
MTDLLVIPGCRPALPANRLTFGLVQMVYGVCPMTKKDYELIAEIIRSLGGQRDSDRLAIAKHFADKLTSTNVRFKRGAFLFACMES